MCAGNEGAPVERQTLKIKDRSHNKEIDLPAQPIWYRRGHGNSEALCSRSQKSRGRAVTRTTVICGVLLSFLLSQSPNDEEKLIPSQGYLHFNRVESS